MNSSWLKNALSKKVLIKDIICTIGEGAVKPGDGGGGGVGGWETFWCRKTLWSNKSKTRASAWPGYPDTEKQMKAWGRRPSAFIVSSMNHWTESCFSNTGLSFMQSAMNGSNFLHDYVFAGVSGEKGKDRSEKGREQNSSPLSP